MPEPATPPNSIDPARAAAGRDALPTVESPLSSAEILAKLDAAARRGKLPGFERATGNALFRLADFGTPFESILEARATPNGPGCTLSFALRIKPAMPRVFLATLLLSVWPGVWLTDSMLRTYFSAYTMNFWWTCVWYLPLTLPFVPVAMKQANKRSRASARAEALLLIAKVQELVGEAAPANTSNTLNPPNPP